MIKFLLKLVLTTSFFFAISIKAAENKKVVTTAGGQVSATVAATVTLSENLSGILKFNGRMGVWLTPETEGMSKPCLSSAQFRKVFYQSKKQIEVFFKLICPLTQQTQEKQTYLSPHFFIDEKTSKNEILLTEISAEIKKLRLRFSEIKTK